MRCSASSSESNRASRRPLVEGAASPHRQTVLASIAALVLATLAIILPAVPPTAHAQGGDLDALLASFRGMSGLSARFTEEKRVALLAVPLRSEGEIHFVAPGTLMRRVTAPTPSSALIDGGRLTMLANGRRQEIDLASNAVVGGFVSSFADVLAGDRVALERTYHIALRARGEGWELTLRPRGAPLDRFLTQMVLAGEGREVKTMRMVEVSGDETITTFHDVRLDRHFSDAERRRIFRLD